MLLSKSNLKNNWSNRQIQLINKYKERIKDIEELNLQNKIYSKDINSLDFYNITPKEELPKFLQKMKFQTLHSKQNVTKAVKVFRKQRQSTQQAKIRKKLKENGQIMFLSEIYQSLGDSIQNSKKSINHQSHQSTKFMDNYGGDLEEWQKDKNSALFDKIMILKKRTHNFNGSPRHRQSRIIQQKLSQLQRKNSKGHHINYFKQGSNYKKQIEKQLDIIYFTHSNEHNQMNKYMLIENSSKLLKKQLDERKIQVQQEIKNKLRILNQTRIQHHQLFQEKSRLGMEQRQFLQEINTKELYGLTMSSTGYGSLGNQKSDKLSQMKSQKRLLIQQNQIKIIKNKKLIQSLQNGIVNLQQQLRGIMIGQVCYFKASLKIGMDCRDSGLGWILKKLTELIGRDKQNITKDSEHQFPAYLDKKSKDFLLIKTQSEDQLEKLLEQKRKFVNQIGQAGSGQKMNKTCMSSGWGDRVVQEQTNATGEIPKKYRRSLRKITMLNQQYAQNQSLLEFKARANKGVDLSSNTDGLSGKRLYQTISQKIKGFDFSSKSKKDRVLNLKNSKLLEYQSLLNSIKQIHLKIEDLDISHENHLVNHYKDTKDKFFEQSAASFGYKKAYSMIIKHFSWKNRNDENVEM